MKIVSDEIGPVASIRAQCLDGWTDRRDLLVAEQSVLAAMRVQRGHSDARMLVPHVAKCRVSQTQRQPDPLRRDHVEGRAERDVRGDPKRRELRNDVHLPEEAGVAGEVREHLVLIGKMPAAAVERGLVERRETDAVKLSIEREVDHVLERVAARAPGLRGHLAARHRGGIQVGEVDHGDVVGRPRHLVQPRIDLIGDADAGVAHAQFQHAGIADDRKASRRSVVAGGQCRRQEFHGDLRPDARRVAEHEADQGLRVHVRRHLIPSRSPVSLARTR